MVKHTPALNEEQITAFLKEAVETVKTEEDPDVLNAYRKIFRKNVPFTLRSYIAAYLIKEFEGSAFPAQNRIVGVRIPASEIVHEVIFPIVRR